MRSVAKGNRASVRSVRLIYAALFATIVIVILFMLTSGYSGFSIRIYDGCSKRLIMGVIEQENRNPYLSEDDVDLLRKDFKNFGEWRHVQRDGFTRGGVDNWRLPRLIQRWYAEAYAWRNVDYIVYVESMRSINTYVINGDKGVPYCFDISLSYVLSGDSDEFPAFVVDRKVDNQTAQNIAQILRQHSLGRKSPDDHEPE